MNIRESNLIRIGFAGRTNSGKTATIRTLMRKAVGVVANKPNVTREAEDYTADNSGVYIGIQAVFVDCPGFQMASLSRHFLDKFDDLLKIDPKAIYDVRAIKALREVDVIVYVADLSNVPDDSYINEIELIKSLGISCVIVLNKFRKTFEEGNRTSAAEMIAQWRAKLREICHFAVIQLDAHWEKPSQVKELYRLISNSLKKDRNVLFEEGLRKFYVGTRKNRSRYSYSIGWVDY